MRVAGSPDVVRGSESQAPTIPHNFEMALFDRKPGTKSSRIDPGLNLLAGVVAQIQELNAGFLPRLPQPDQFAGRLNPILGFGQPEPDSREALADNHFSGLHADAAFADIQDQSAIVIVEIDVGDRPDCHARVSATVRYFGRLTSRFFFIFKHRYIFKTGKGGDQFSKL